MARLGLGYEQARQRNPGLVYISVTGFGQDGPHRDLPATDAAMQAYSGFSFGAGDMRDPVRVRVSVVDIVTGVYVSNAALAALMARHGNQGKGSTSISASCTASAPCRAPSTPSTPPPGA